MLKYIYTFVDEDSSVRKQIHNLSIHAVAVIFTYNRDNYL